MRTKTTYPLQSTFFVVLLCLLCTCTYAQVEETTFKKVYLQAATGVAGSSSAPSEFSIGSVLKKNWSATLSYHHISEMTPKNQPSDYNPGYSTFLFIPFANESPSVDMSLLSVTAGRFLRTGRNTWIDVEGGVSVVNGEKIKYTRAIVDHSGVDPMILLFGISYASSNYTTTKEKKTTAGMMLRTDFNWAFTSYLGIGCGAFANINSIQSPVGLQVKLMIGWMPHKARP